MSRLALVLLACASCDRVWGLDSVGLHPGDAPEPGDLGAVTGHYTARWFSVAPMTVVEHDDEFAMADLSSAVVTLDDGRTRAVAITDQGFSFTTPNAGDHYSLRIETPVGSRTWNLSSPTLELVERYIHPPDRRTVMPGTIVELAMNPAGLRSGVNEELDTIGTWSRTKVNTSLGATNIKVDCTTRDQFGVQIGEIEAPSAAFYTSTESVSNYNHLTYAVRTNDVMTVDGATATFPSTGLLMAAPVTTDLCTKLLVHSDVEWQRNHDVVPNADGLSALSALWSVNIDPAIDFGFLSTALPVAGGPPNATISAQYGNPFGYGTVDVMMTSFASNFDGAASQSVVVVPAGSDHCTNVLEIDAGAIALPMNVRLGDIPLVTRAQPMTVSGSHMTIAWDITPVGRADVYVVLVERLVNGAPTEIENITTTETSVSIPTAELTSAGEFQILVIAAIGFPGVMTGDLVTAASPVGIATFATPSFKIQ